MLGYRAAPINVAQIRRVGAVRTCSLPHVLIANPKAPYPTKAPFLYPRSIDSR
jgi:hypothetical protein